MTNYEITYIINPSLDEAAKNELVERFDNILKNDGAEIVESKLVSETTVDRDSKACHGCPWRRVAQFRISGQATY